MKRDEQKNNFSPDEWSLIFFIEVNVCSGSFASVLTFDDVVGSPETNIFYDAMIDWNWGHGRSQKRAKGALAPPPLWPAKVGEK